MSWESLEVRDGEAPGYQGPVGDTLELLIDAPASDTDLGWFGREWSCEGRPFPGGSEEALVTLLVVDRTEDGGDLDLVVRMPSAESQKLTAGKQVRCQVQSSLVEDEGGDEEFTHVDTILTFDLFPRMDVIP